MKQKLQKRQKRRSMKWQMTGIMMICWLIPFALMVGVLGVYITSNHSSMTAQNFERQLEFNDKICVERLNGVVAASRQASYDKVLLDTNSQYETGELSYAKASRKYHSYLTSTYQKNHAVSSAILWFNGEKSSEEEKLYSTYNERFDGSFQQIRRYREKHHGAVKQYAGELGTGIGFFYQDGALYLIRNLMDERYAQRGVLVLCLNQNYCFDSLIQYPMGDGVYITVNDIRVPLEVNAKLESWWEAKESSEGAENENSRLAEEGGYEWRKGRLCLMDRQEGDNYSIQTIMMMQKEITQFPFYGYQYVIGGMIFSLIPMLILIMHVFRRQVSDPVALLSEGAGHIQEGELGYQIEQQARNLEFAYLTDAMNEMSAHLKRQFDKIYQEEIALREARIMALQSHINPHFMNNTLEIINWEARLGGNLKVSKMIEALSTMLDAAMDRRSRPLVRLAEEMGYVNSYLYITKERLGKRLTVEMDLPEELMDFYVPRLILQPVVENAVEHGVVPNGSGTVSIRAYCEKNHLYLETVNGGGLTAEDKERVARLLDPKYNVGKEPAVNLGIANVNQRLRILYGEPCGLTITEDKKCNVVAKLTMLLVRNETEIDGMDKKIQ